MKPRKVESSTTASTLRRALASVEAAHPERKPVTDRELIEVLEARGFMISRDERTARVVRIPTAAVGQSIKTVRIAVATDTHLGSKYQQLTHWRDFMTRATAWGAEFCLHLGDLVDGSQMRKGHEYEVFKHGADAQAHYAIKVMPKLLDRKDHVLPTYIIGGNHDEDFWKAAGANVLQTVADHRPDLYFLGAPQATFHVGPLRLYLLHPRGGMAYARCLDEETEVLTDRGWKRFPDMEPDDQVATLTPEHAVEWHVPSERQTYWYDGPMYQVRSRFVDLLCTPEHSVYAGSAQGGRRWHLARMDELASDWRDDWYGKWRFKKNAPPQVGPVPATFAVPPLTKRYNKPVLHLGEVPMRPLLRFLGYYTAEGCVSRGRSKHPDGVVNLSQYRAMNAHISDDMAACVRALGASPNVGMKRVQVASRELAGLALSCGRGSANKRIPRWIFELDASLQWEFFDAYCAGDASKNENGCFVSATTKSRQLADDLQEMAFRLGFSGNVRPTKGHPWYSVTFNVQKNEPRIDRPVEKVPYAGLVYDLTVQNHVFFVRRNGRCYWTGNSYRLQKIIEQFAPDEKPHVLMMGHYHIACHLPAYRNVEGFFVPCFQGQTPFLKTLGLAPVVGGLLLELAYSKRGLEGLETKWVIYHRHLQKDWP